MNDLRIGQNGKGIPYHAHSEVRPDGEANHGFINLKGDLKKLDLVPELKRDPALYELVSAINQSSTGIISIGCTSGQVVEERGQRMSGYVEFAFNSDNRISDAANYFPVFFHFDRALNADGFDEEMHFGWELEGATFLETGAAGFTATIYLNTGFSPTIDGARKVWDVSLSYLGQYLGSILPDDGQPLY